MDFKPWHWKDGDLPLKVVETIEHENFTFVVCEYGFMYGFFHYGTGAKVADIDITKNIGHTEAKYIEVVKQKAFDTLDLNPNWHDVIDGLRIINKGDGN